MQQLSLLIGIPNYSLIDSWWAAVHIVSGIGLGALFTALGKRFFYLRERPNAYAVLITLLVAWEFCEAVLRNLPPALQVVLQSVLHRGYFEGESALNILGDIAVGIMGFWVTYGRLRKKRQA